MTDAIETRPSSRCRTPAEADAKFVELDGDESVIPTGFYCYDRVGGWKQDDKEGLPYYKIKTCPYWAIDSDRPEQDAGYCAFLKEGDWDDFGILWDQVKSCSVRREMPEDWE